MSKLGEVFQGLGRNDPRVIFQKRTLRHREVWRVERTLPKSLCKSRAELELREVTPPGPRLHVRRPGWARRGRQSARTLELDRLA